MSPDVVIVSTPHPMVVSIFFCFGAGFAWGVQAVAFAVDPAMIDRVFSNSPNLSTEAVKHFVTQLCAVSSQEVNHSAATFR